MLINVKSKGKKIQLKFICLCKEKLPSTNYKLIMNSQKSNTLMLMLKNSKDKYKLLKETKSFCYKSEPLYIYLTAEEYLLYNLLRKQETHTSTTPD